MTDEQFTVMGWTPSLKQREAALLRARGHTQQQCADAVGLDIREIQRWHEIPEWVALVEEHFLRSVERIEPGLMANIDLAIDVQRQMLRGELKPDDKRYLEARRLIDRIMDRLLSVDRNRGEAQPPVSPPSSITLPSGS